MGINRIPKKSLAVGYWGNSTYRRIQLDQTQFKIERLNLDKVIAGGRPVTLWQPAISTDPGVVPCTCRKNTTDLSDRACLSCFGSSFAPGYFQFLTQTMFWCSAEAGSSILTNVAVTNFKKANLVGLTDTSLTGTYVTADKTYTNLNNVAWSLQLIAYKENPTNTFTLEYSTDAGSTWHSLVLTLDASGIGYNASLTLAGSGSIRYRVTLTRASLNDATPYFEILRMRRVTTENENANIKLQRPDLGPGQILLIKPWTNEGETIEAGRGRVTDYLSEKTSTVGLQWFDISITRNTPSCRIREAQAGPHSFYQLHDPILGSPRLQMVHTYISTQFGVNNFTRQQADVRLVQSGESLNLVW